MTVDSRDEHMDGLKFNVSNHSRITSEANSGILTSEQLAIVIANNVAQDGHQVDSKRHFDNCCFAEGAAYIKDEWHKIEVETDPLTETALIAFGRLLHTVQDFYAHSNWIELHQSDDPIPIWDLNLNTLPSGIVSGTWSIGYPKNCTSQAPHHSQLNKDDPESEEGRKVVAIGPNHGKTLFTLAYDAAIRASSKQFEQLKNVNKK